MDVLVITVISSDFPGDSGHPGPPSIPKKGRCACWLAPGGIVWRWWRWCRWCEYLAESFEGGRKWEEKLVLEKKNGDMLMGFSWFGGEGILKGGRSLMISGFLINYYQLWSSHPMDERALKLGMKNWMKFLAAWVYSTRCLWAFGRTAPCWSDGLFLFAGRPNDWVKHRLAPGIMYVVLSNILGTVHSVCFIMAWYHGIFIMALGNWQVSQ